MSRKLSVHIEVTVEEDDSNDFLLGIANAIPELIQAHYGDVDVAKVEAITSAPESEFALTEQ